MAPSLGIPANGCGAFSDLQVCQAEKHGAWQGQGLHGYQTVPDKGEERGKREREKRSVIRREWKGQKQFKYWESWKAIGRMVHMICLRPSDLKKRKPG